MSLNIHKEIHYIIYQVFCLIFQKRALKLQQQKMKENLEREQQREREIEEDRKLAAKRPSPTASTKTVPHR